MFKFKNKYIILLVLLIISSSVFLLVLNKKAKPVIMNYAIVQTKKVGIEVLRSTGIREVNKRLKNKEIFNTITNNNGEIESVDFNTSVINETMVLIAQNVRKRLKEVEEGKNLPDEMYDENIKKSNRKGIIYEVPLGVAYNNAFLSNYGPTIPVKIKYSGNVGLDIKTRVKPYGLNSALIEVYVYIEVNQRTILPFQSKDIKLVSEVPVIMRIVKGTIPNYLTNDNSSYNLPIN